MMNDIKINDVNQKRIAETLSVFQFMQLFPDEDAAREFYVSRRWRDGVRCPTCDHAKIMHLGRKGYYKCHKCRGVFTAKSGTVMERSKVGIRAWLFGMYVIVTGRKGISAMQFSKEVGVTYKTAWFLFHRIREAMRSGSTDLLQGIVEIDETYIGGRESNKHKNKQVKGAQGRSTKTKEAVIGIRERGGRVRARSVDKLNSETIQAFIDKNVVRGSIISTDEARFYRPVRGYHKLLVNHSVGEFINGMAHTNGIESVWALLKRGYHGTFHHFSKKHIDRYVDEFVFRLNQGSCEIDTMDRIKAICEGAIGKRLTYKQLIGKVSYGL